MAEEIRLVGSFQDNITSKLKKLNTEINSVTKSFQKMGRKLRPIARDMGKLAAASDRVAQNLAKQRQGINATTQALRAYTTASRKAASQSKKFKPSTIPTPRQPRGGGPSGGGRGGGLGMAGAGALTGFAVAGQQMGAMIMQGLARAFEMYKNVLLMPFKFIADGLKERIDDEMDDIKSAGGILSISKRMENPFVESFDQAMGLTKETNRYLAELAGALPGDTQQYIQISRQISDGIYQAIANDKEGSLALAQKIAAENGRALSYDGVDPTRQTQLAGKEIIGEMTKLTVLGSMGQRQGAMGLPQLVERMIGQEQVGMGQFRRYAAIFRDPMIKGALERNIEKINMTGKNTSERLEALRNTLQEVVTPELVRAYQRSTAGVLEELKTLFLNPEVGMLGLGRPLKKMSKTFNAFGEQLFTLEKDIEIGGKVIKKGATISKEALTRAGISLSAVGDAAMESISVFDYLRDIFANFIIAFKPLIELLTQTFMGFENLGGVLDKVREFSYKLANSFEQYRVGLEEVAKTVDEEARTAFTASIPFRASLATFNNLLRALGVVSPEEFQKNAENLKNPNFTAFGDVAVKLVEQFLTSDAAVQFGRQIGEIFGTILDSFADMIEGIVSGEGASNIFSGFIEGFTKAKGVKAAKRIMGVFVDALMTIIGMLVSTFPVESFAVALIALAPAIISGLVAALPGIVSGLFSALTGGAAVSSIGGAISAGLSAILASPALIAAIIAGLAITAKVTEKPREGLLKGMAQSAQQKTDSVRDEDGNLRTLQGNGLAGIMDGLMGELTWVVHDFIKGFGDIFTGLYNIVVGAFTDPAMVTEGINQIFSGLWSLFTMVGHLIIAIGYAVPGLIMVVLVAIKNLVVGIAMAIGNVLYMAVGGAGGWGSQLVTAVGNFFNSMGAAIANGAQAVGDWGGRLGTSVGNFFDSMMGQINSALSAAAGWGARLAGAVGNFFRNLLNKIPGVNIGGGGDEASSSYDGNTSRTMSLGSAIATENKMKPAGSHLVIANSSETVIPANKGYSPYGMGGGVNVTNNFTINGGGMDPQTLAEEVARVVMASVEEASYSEIYTS